MSEAEIEGSLLSVFLIDVGKASRAVSGALAALEANPGALEPMTAVTRAAHSLKGAAGAVMSVEDIPQLASVIQFAHALEDSFLTAKAGKIALEDNDIDAFTEGAKLLESLAATAELEFLDWLDVNANELARQSSAYAEISTRGAKAPAGNAAAHPPSPQKPSPAPESKKPPRSQPPHSKPEAADLGDMSMLSLFRMEAETNTQILSEGLMKVEGRPSDLGAMEPMMRAAHSLKGAARILQFDDVVALAHSMESRFAAAMEGKRPLNTASVDKLLEGVDLIRKLSEIQEDAINGFLSSEAARMASLAALYKAEAEGQTLQQLRQEAPPAPPDIAERRLPKASEAGVKDNFVRVSSEKLDRLLALAGDSYVDTKKLRSFGTQLLNIKKAVSEISGLARLTAPMERRGALLESSRYAAIQLKEGLEALYSSVSDLHIDFSGFLLKSENFSDSLYNEVVSCRIRPFEDGASSFPRMVRDIARKLDKKVKLSITGQATGVDRDILEKLGAPLTHILRNAIDHGLESPAERLAAGKPETGSIELSAYHWAGMLNIKIADDGRGIDIERIREKVVEKSLAAPEMAKSLTEAELLEFLFLPGFTTAKAVTEISGRGVGLDVVQAMLQEVRGSVKIQTVKGGGTCFHLLLPITLSVVSSLLVRIGGEPYAFPLMRVERLLRVPREEIKSIENHQFVVHDGLNIGLISAREILGYPLEEPEEDEEIMAVVISDRLKQYAIMVDAFSEERKLVVRPLDPRLGKLPYISSASVLDDGSTALIVDVDDMARSIDSLLKGGRLHKIRKGKSDVKKGQRKRALVIDDSITVRELERNLIGSQGYEVEIAVDGADGWNALRTGSYDIVITDIDMPRMNGYELVERIKANEKLKDTPVIIVSYKDREEDRLKGLEAGAEYFLTKGSFHDNTLITAVRDLIGDPAR